MNASQPGGMSHFNYDWTFTTLYQGTMPPETTVERQPAPSPVQIPLDKLKLPDPIYWFDEVHLFEDELADNGTAELSIKCVRNGSITGFP